MKSPSKMNLSELRIALKQAKNDTKNTGNHWRGIADSKDYEIKRLERGADSLSDYIHNRDKIIADLQAQIKNQAETILNMAGQMFG